jgi:probable HAF family extracellular repeat protein
VQHDLRNPFGKGKKSSLQKPTRNQTYFCQFTGKKEEPRYMKSKFRMLLSAITFIAGLALLFAALALPLRLAAQDKQDHNHRHHHYRLIDIGTFGGPNNGLPFGLDLNNQGTVAGCADTSTSNPKYPNFNPFLGTPWALPDPFISHAFRWQNGTLTDSGALPGVNNSCVSFISGNGLIVGASENGVIDPLTGWPAMEAVLWNKGQVINLGTFGGNESFAIGVNTRGEVVGAAANTILDPFSIFFGWGTQTRAFLWRNGVLQDLGTLGGPDALATQINERGQIFGASYINSIPNPITGVPPFDAFLYENGTMLDIPNSFGGSQVNPFAVNNRGELVGNATLPGEVFMHPFLWRGGPLIDLGTFGGDFGEANDINDAGEIAGQAFFPGNNFTHGFLWKNGILTDLGTVSGDPCSTALGINSKRQIVGTSGICFVSNLHAFLWEDGQIVDLNTLVAPDSGLQLTVALNINDRGEIAGNGVLLNGDTHAFLLIPCGEGDEGCEGENPTGVTQSSPTSVAQRPAAATPANQTLSGRGMMDRFRSRWGQRYHFPGPAFGPKN